MVARVIPVEEFDLVIFGGTGDLARRKILPGLYRRFWAEQMPAGARIIGAARTEQDSDAWRAFVREAIEEAARIRLRPIVMTLVSTILGALPLILATGPGSEARSAVGWVVFGGMGLATVFTLYLTPVAYLGIARFAKTRASAGQKLQQELVQGGLQD